MTAIVFLQYRPGIYHIANPWIPKDNWAPEMVENHVALLCGHSPLKTEVEHVVTTAELRLCGSCRNRASLYSSIREGLMDLDAES